jgi:hypothetical protein
MPDPIIVNKEILEQTFDGAALFMTASGFLKNAGNTLLTSCQLTRVQMFWMLRLAPAAYFCQSLDTSGLQDT